MSIGVCIPVGPKPHHAKWLDECLSSLVAQTKQAEEVLIIDDMAGLDFTKLKEKFPTLPIKYYKAPWLLGVAHAFNFGVALAATEATFMLGADDTLEPNCLKECEEVFSRNGFRKDTYYYVGVKYMSTGVEQYLACNAAMVTKELWKRCGGFPVESALGAPDTMLLSIMLKHGELAGRMACVNTKKTLYNYRDHELTETKAKAFLYGAIGIVRNELTASWSKPEWGRYE